MLVDAHVHVWSDNMRHYPFHRRPEVPGSAELLLAEMERSGVARAVIVQPIHYLYDHRYVVGTLRRHPGRFAGVALVDTRAPDALDGLEERLAEGFGGIRLHLSRQDDPAMLAEADQDPIWRRLAEVGGCITVLGQAAELPTLEPIARRHPEVPVVLDHLGQPPVGEAAPRPLLENVLNLAGCPNVYVKVSNLHRLSATAYPHRDTWPMVRHVYEAFGPRRLMWGTDFPFVLGSCGYARALELITHHLEFLSEADRSWLLFRTAQRLWSFEA